MTQTAADADISTVGRLLDLTIGYFVRHELETPRLDAEILLAAVLACTRIQLYVMYAEEVGESDRSRYREMIKERAAGKPVAYLVGEKEFFSLSFRVTPAVLIPRPETEVLVEAAIDFSKALAAVRFLDVGVGSGAIAVTLAKKLPHSSGVAVDLSPEAIAIAKDNAERHLVADRLTFLRSDLFESAPAEAFDLVLSNPPYIAHEEMKTLPVEVGRYEPRIALDGGAGGMTVIRRLVDRVGVFLRPGGRLFFEIGAGQAAAAAKTIEQRPELEKVAILNDYSGRPRVVVVQRRQ